VGLSRNGEKRERERREGPSLLEKEGETFNASRCSLSGGKETLSQKEEEKKNRSKQPDGSVRRGKKDARSSPSSA